MNPVLVVLAIVTAAGIITALTSIGVALMQHDKNHGGKLLLTEEGLLFRAPEADEARLRTATRKALRLIMTMATFDARRVQRALQGVTIVVLEKSRWPDTNGRTVDSEFLTPERIIVVNESLAGLAHELIHAIEYAIDGRIDGAHTRWGDRRLHLVETRYLCWLRGPIA